MLHTQEGHIELTKANGNECGAFVTEIVVPAIPEWCAVFAKSGRVIHTKCHQIQESAERNRIYLSEFEPKVAHRQ